MIALLRRIGAHPTIMPLTARVICARLVRESPRFLAAEFLRPAGVRLYHLRESGVKVAIRHRSADEATLAEVFRDRCYDPPPAIREVLGTPHEVLDLGANIGLFGALAIALWPTARIVGYEPDPANAAVLARTIDANGSGERWSVVRAAAGARDGQVSFATGLNASSHVAGLGEGAVGGGAIVVEMRDVLDAIAGADLVKMDIEGGEWEIICDPRFALRPPRVLVLEYHPQGCPDDDPRAAAERELERAGLRTQPIAHGEHGVGMLWAWRA